MKLRDPNEPNTLEAIEDVKTKDELSDQADKVLLVMLNQNAFITPNGEDVYNLRIRENGEFLERVPSLVLSFMKTAIFLYEQDDDSLKLSRRGWYRALDLRNKVN